MLFFLFGIVSYIVGLGGLVFFILFIGGWDFLPFHIDSGTPDSLGLALGTNFGLMLLFGLQHSVMARPAFKNVWTKFVPAFAERSVYVFLSGILMCVICFFWKPIDGTLWNVDHPTIRIILILIQIVGWAIAVFASFLINHFELFGVQQVYFHMMKKPEPIPDFTERSLYKVVRHPLQLGMLIGMWTTPTMTATHLMLSATMTMYIFIGLHFEEKNLVAALGESYQEYQSRVRMILPIPKSIGPTQSE